MDSSNTIRSIANLDKMGAQLENQYMEKITYLDGWYTKTINRMGVPKTHATSSEQNSFVRCQLIQDFVDISVGKIRRRHLSWKQLSDANAVLPFYKKRLIVTFKLF